MDEGQAAASTPDDDAPWTRFARKFRAEINDGDTGKVLDVLAALSKTAHFSIGCYCADERRCHRAILRQLLAERGAEIV